MKISLRSIFRLYRILSIPDIGVGDKPINPFTGQLMSFSDRCVLKQTMLNEWLVENGFVKRVTDSKWDFGEEDAKEKRRVTTWERTKL